MRSDARKRAEEFRGDRLIVGLIGKKRAGKDTFAAPLVEHRGFTRLAFADPLKEAALGLDPFVEIEVDDGSCGDEECCGGPYTYTEYRRLSEVVEREGWERAKEYDDVRRTLQRFGTESIRALDPGFWPRATMSRMQAPGSYVVTDVRFPNEAEAIHEAGGVLVRITRPDLPSTDEHSSETALDGYPADLEVINSGTAETLAETARHLLF